MKPRQWVRVLTPPISFSSETSFQLLFWNQIIFSDCPIAYSHVAYISLKRERGKLISDWASFDYWRKQGGTLGPAIPFPAVYNLVLRGRDSIFPFLILYSGLTGQKSIPFSLRIKFILKTALFSAKGGCLFHWIGYLALAKQTHYVGKRLVLSFRWVTMLASSRRARFKTNKTSMT